MKQSKTDYRGGEAIVLSTDALELTAAHIEHWTLIGASEKPAAAQAFAALKTAVEKWVKGLK
jgi:hypothetical protein